jgi:Tfp pilus assembly protein PilN
MQRRWPLRDVEFLPAWYPQIRRRKFAVVVQAWASLGVIVLLLGITLVKHWEVHCAQAAAVECSDQINESQQQLARLNEKLQYEGQLSQQEQIIAKLGLNVDTTRLVNALEDAMPQQMSLTDLTVETEENMEPTMNVTGAKKPGTTPDAPQVDRRLKVRLDGVSPSDLELASLIENLNRVKFFDDVATSYARPVTRSGHLIREFEVSFSVNLNAPVDTAVADGK